MKNKKIRRLSTFIAVAMLLSAFIVPIAHASVQITEVDAVHAVHAIDINKHGHSHDDWSDDLPDSHLLSHNPVDHAHDTHGLVLPLRNTNFDKKPISFHHYHPDLADGLIYELERPPRLDRS